MVVHPVVSWAQRSSETEPEKNVLFITIEVQDPQGSKIDLSSDALKFTAKTGDGSDTYALDLKFYDSVVPEKSHWNEAGNHITFVIQKADARAEYWPRLLKEKLKLHYIKTDFDKWVDEDEQDEQADDDNQDMANMMGGQGGPGGAGDLDFSQLLAGAGAGGAGGPDLSALASQLGGGSGGAGGPDLSALASQLGTADSAESPEDASEQQEDEEK